MMSLSVMSHPIQWVSLSILQSQFPISKRNISIVKFTFERNFLNRTHRQMCPLFWPTWFVILFMATKVTEKISHPIDCTTFLALWLSSKSTKSFTHTTKTFIQLKIMKKRLLMSHKNNSLSDSWPFLDPDSASVISVVSRDAMAVSLSIPMSSLWTIFAGMKRKKYKWNSIGE